MKAIAEKALLGDLHAGSYRKKVKEMRTIIDPMKKMLRPMSLENEEQLFTTTTDEHIPVASLTFDQKEVQAVTTRIHDGLKQRQMLTEAASIRPVNKELLELVKRFGRFHVNNLTECEWSLGNESIRYVERPDLQAPTSYDLAMALSE